MTISDTGIQEAESGAFTQEMNFKVGEHTGADGVQDITVRITAETTHSDGDVTLDFSYMQGGTEITSDIDTVPEASKVVVQACMDIADNGIRQNLHTIEQAAEQKQEEAKPMEQEQEQKKGWRPEQTGAEEPQKRSFPTSPALKNLEETMKRHEPFAVMAMSTSGIDMDAEPVRVVVQEYVFNEELKRYETGIGFDKLGNHIDLRSRRRIRKTPVL